MPLINIEIKNKRKFRQSLYLYNWKKDKGGKTMKCLKCGSKLLSTGMCSNLMCDYTAKEEEATEEKVIFPEWITGTEEELIQRVKENHGI